MVEYVVHPTLRAPALIGAFMGFPDAGLGASGAVRHLIEQVGAARLARIDPEEFYDFGELRPLSRVVGPGERTLEWPAPECWYWLAPEPAGESGPPPSDLVILLAAEPRLRWRAFARTIAGLAVTWGVRQALFLGSAFADVPHTREPLLTGWATSPELREALARLGIPFSAYQGPSSVQSAVMEALRERGIPAASVFGNAPHYLPVPNPAVAAALLRGAVRLLRLPVTIDLKPLQEAAAALAAQADEAVAQRPELRAYLRRLELQYDRSRAPLAPGQVPGPGEEEEPVEPLPAPEDVVREVENFLRRRTTGEGGSGGAPGPEEGAPPPAGTGPQSPPGAPPHGPGA